MTYTQFIIQPTSVCTKGLTGREILPVSRLQLRYTLTALKLYELLGLLSASPFGVGEQGIQTHTTTPNSV